MSLTSAERVRSMLAVSLELRLDGERHARHVVTPDGSLLLRHQSGTVLPAAGDLAVLTGTDVASVPQPDRVRGSFRMQGHLTPWSGPRPQGILSHLAGAAEDVDAVRVVRFSPTGVALAWSGEPDPTGRPSGEWHDVDLTAYAAAAPDPLVGAEQRWLPHLQRDHAEELRALAGRAYPALDGTVEVRALSLDRHGVVLRLYADLAAGGGRLDVRVGFPDPASCECEVRAAFAGLLVASAQRHR